MNDARIRKFDVVLVKSLSLWARDTCVFDVCTARRLGWQKIANYLTDNVPRRVHYGSSLGVAHGEDVRRYEVMVVSRSGYYKWVQFALTTGMLE